ncbi:hypothetical protein [Flagellimonas nanhaiensis]|uniref:SGNH/GDSL hydrolase family protein n=1 Tax=Flagellimonas nanhaiensis TaxID=2292706 RepID=A0A371JKR7_9FLAO|nr:hypothetical protein [Allomuricauda nanhaiensis]RDY57553.1 hypothetical protein DX873_18640 [Allomuricauda nanhaiensis]
MIKLIKKLALYAFLIALVLEVLIRAFHLYNELPQRYVAEDGILKWVPGQQGYAVYGNRRQNFTEYKINSSGYNSYREFYPSDEKIEVAIIGDSYIEGFHQNYHNSIGKKIEGKLDGVEVFEYGHSSNDLADQLYLIHANEDIFDKVDYIILYLKYENDLLRSEYKFIKRTPLFPVLRHSKLVLYLLNIGMADPVKKAHKSLISIKDKISGGTKGSDKEKPQINIDSLYLENFKGLVAKYGLNKAKTALLLDSGATDKNFLGYLNEQQIDFIDFANSFEAAGGSRKTTLIYDRHWNNKGREIVADEIYGYLLKKLSKQ